MTESLTLRCDPIANLPWENRPAGCSDVVWRYSANPIIGRHHIPKSNSLFNSAVVADKGAFRGVFRCDNNCMRSQLHPGKSADGIHWDIDHEPIVWQAEDPEIQSDGGYDPRVVKIDDTWYVIWCNGYHGATIGLGSTKDWKTWKQLENAFLPFNRNGVLFPRKIDGRFALLSRPSDNGHTPFGEIFYSESPDLTFWGRHRHVMKSATGWDWLKLGAGPAPIETSEGWLLIFHGVINSCTGYVYRAGAALLDLDKPWKVIVRGNPYLLGPETLYETTGDVPNVVFPCAALCDQKSGKIAMYYGAADTVVGLAFGYAHEIVDYIKKNPVKR
jgi:beta-1,4-mannooligosaccharide/beta-1,4-mannosyl-N-acetylglucosamine phosphorylase